MFREMRRKNQLLPEEETAAILREGSSGVLSVLGDDGYPYGVPLSYLYEDGKLYFHCALSGHKLDALRREPRASFCVIARDEVVPGAYTTEYRSAIAFGRVRELAGEEKFRAIDRLTAKYYPEEDPEHRRAAIEGSLGRLCLLEMAVERLTGKGRG